MNIFGGLTNRSGRGSREKEYGQRERDRRADEDGKTNGGMGGGGRERINEKWGRDIATVIEKKEKGE